MTKDGSWGDFKHQLKNDLYFILLTSIMFVRYAKAFLNMFKKMPSFLCVLYIMK
jgi:hypothetical protein